MQFQTSWLLWIVHLMKNIGRQGLYNGLVYAASLETWHTFETNNGLLQEDVPKRYSIPSLRAISVVAPDSNGNQFNTYYAKPAIIDELLMGNYGPMYYLLGHSNISCRPTHDKILQDIHVYHQEGHGMELFTPDWLQNQAICLEWQQRSLQAEFDLDRILQDHINGGQLLVPINFDE